MAEIKNSWLQKYEIKKPDYDYIAREYIGMKDAEYAPARYEKKGEQWISKKQTKKLLGKKKIRLMFVGDITCFEKQFEEAKKGRDYDFSYEFDEVRPIFAEADLVVGNLETMIFPEAPYRTEKYVAEQNFHCNAPIEFLDAVRKAGIDVLTNANNHHLDTGAVGIGETIDYIERFGFIHTGTFKSEKKRYEIIDVDGFKIAIAAFTMEHNNKKCNLTLEGIDFLLNDYSKEKAEEVIKAAREDGAEVVITCIHWGKENKSAPNKTQIKTAKELADLGYDCIIGSHPHVLQLFTILNKDKKGVPVFYSMGNFVSHNVDNQKARSMIACVELERRMNKINVACSYIPIFTSKSYGKKKYVVLPINERPSDSRNIKKLDQITAVVGKELEQNKSIKFKECIEKKDLFSLQKKEEEKTTLDLSTVKSFPVRYDNGKFVFQVYEDHACIEAVSKSCTTSSYSTPATILGLPVTDMIESAFARNSNMKKINLGKNLPFVAKKMCKECRLLEGFQVGSGIVEIREEAFADCENLTAAVMKVNVEKIGNRAFANCPNLRSVKLPVTVTEIAEDAFEGCPKAVFYCEEESYAEQYAKDHDFKIAYMKLY